MPGRSDGAADQVDQVQASVGGARRRPAAYDLDRHDVLRHEPRAFRRRCDERLLGIRGRLRRRDPGSLRRHRSGAAGRPRHRRFRGPRFSRGIPGGLPAARQRGMNPSVPYFRANALPLLTFSVAILGLVVLLPLPAQAAEQRLVGDVVVGPHTVEHDVSTGAGDLEVRGLVENDVHSGFGDVLVSGKVKGDIDAGFGDVKIEGPVEGDVNAGFGDVYVNAPVNGDVSVGQGDVDLGPEAAISGNLECESGEITGNTDAVKGNMLARGMAFDFDEPHEPGIVGFVGWLFAALAFAACAVLAAMLAPGPLGAAARRVE